MVDGHSRLRHGLHSTGSRTTRESGRWAGSDIVGRAEDGDVGTPSAEAMCIAPESLVRYTRQAAAMSMNSASEVSPAKFCAGDVIAAVTDAHNSRSSFDPNTATDAPSSPATRLAASAKRSGSQRLAVP